MDCIAIIPARFTSTRFPGKLLASLAGRPLIRHVVESVSRVEGIDATIVATDDERIGEAARESGVDVVLSGGEFASGTDRVADAASRYSAEIIVNVQGDELLLDPAAVAGALDCFRDSATELGTLRAPLKERRDFWDPNAVKVVIDDNEQALYFSRAAEPFHVLNGRRQSTCPPLSLLWRGPLKLLTKEVHAGHGCTWVSTFIVRMPFEDGLRCPRHVWRKPKALSSCGFSRLEKRSRHILSMRGSRE